MNLTNPRRIDTRSRFVACSLQLDHDAGARAIYDYGMVQACQACRNRIDQVLKEQAA